MWARTQALWKWGLDDDTVSQLTGSALRKGPNGQYEAEPTDSLLRILLIPTHDGVEEIAVLDSDQASRIGEYWNAVHRYLETGDVSVKKFEGIEVTDGAGKRFPLLTDLQELDRLGSAGVLSFDAHLAAFFWQVDHVFEALGIAIKKGQKEHADLKYFWAWGQELEKVEALPTYKEINAYRNKSHEFPAVIGCKWEDKGAGPKFVHHFLPTIAGHEAKEEIDINDQLQKYFEFAANVWLSFSPGDYKQKSCTCRLRGYPIDDSPCNPDRNTAAPFRSALGHLDGCRLENWPGVLLG